MNSSQLAALGLSLIRISVFTLYALAGVICWRKLFPRLSITARRLSGIFFVAQLVVIAMALRDQPPSLFEQWLWDVHDEGNVPSTLASTQLALAAGVALLTGWLARARPNWERLYFFALAIILFFVARDEYVSLHEHVDNWEKYYIALGIVVVAATLMVAARSSRSRRVWHICLLTGLALSAIGAIAFEANPLFCGRWDFLPLEGCLWAAHYEESLEFMGIWLVLVALLGQYSIFARPSHARLSFTLYVIPPLWIFLLLYNSFVPRLDLALRAEPANVQYESGAQLKGFRIDGAADGTAVWLYIAAQSRDVLGIGYSIQLVDQVTETEYARLRTKADMPVGFLIAPDYNHLYRQRLELAMPAQTQANSAYHVVLQLWREHDGDSLYEGIVASDLNRLDATKVVLGELTISAETRA